MDVGWNKVKKTFRRACPATRDRGFTLVELLFAIFIFSIVISLVYGSYRATFHIVNGSEAQLDMSHRARVVMHRISEDLHSIVAGPGGVLRGETNEYSGVRGDTLSFVSSAHLVLKKSDTRSGHTLIHYSVEVDEDSNLLNLYRSDTLLLPGIDSLGDEPQKHLLCRGLQELRFTYVNEEGSENDEWSSNEGDVENENGEQEVPFLPNLMYVELRFAESNESENTTVFKTGIALPQQQRNQE